MKSSQNVLVTGASGFVGTALIDELLLRKYVVTAVSRKDKNAKGDFKSFKIKDLNSGTDFSKALNGIHSVVHLAARVHVMNDHSLDPLAEYRKVNYEGTVNLARCAAESGVKKFVFISTVKVNGEGDNRNIYCDVNVPEPIDAYARSKWEAENALRDIEKDSGMRVIILRPPLIYGPGVGANFLKLINVVGKEKYLPFKAIRNKRSMIALTNFINIICACLEKDFDSGKTYLVSDGVDYSTPELVDAIAKALSKKSKQFYFPVFLLKFLGAITNKSNVIDRITNSLRIDPTVFMNELESVQLISINDELKKLVEEYNKK